MRQDKYNRMIAQYNGHRGPITVSAVMEGVPDALMHLTGRELGMVMSAINAAYHRGRASCHAEVIDGDAVWIEPLGCLYELSDIAALPLPKREPKKEAEG